MICAFIFAILTLLGCLVIKYIGDTNTMQIVAKSTLTPLESASRITPYSSLGSSTTPTISAPTYGVETVGHFTLEHERVIQIGLTDSYIYWVSYAHRDQIRRRALSAVGGADEVFVVSTYDHGMVDVNPPILTVGQLVFLDASTNYKQWQIRAVNLNTKTERVIAQDDHADNPPPRLQGHGPWVVITFVKESADKGCAVSTLEAFNLESTEKVILSQECIENNYLWNYGMAFGQIVVAERDHSTTQGGATQIVSFDLLTKQSAVVSTNDSSSEPDISTGFIVWKAAKRFDYGNRIWVLNRTTSQLEEIALPSPYAYMSLNGEWVYWPPAASDEPMYVYNLQTRRSILVATPAKDEDILTPTVFDKLIAWVRVLNLSTPSESSSVIEWASLAEHSSP
jgi:hypothetical protein